MPSPDHIQRMMREARGLSCDEFVRRLEGERPLRSGDYVSIQELAVELGVSIRTLRRWNNRPDAPKRYRRGRREMYRRVDVQHWFERRARRLNATQAGDESD